MKRLLLTLTTGLLAATTLLPVHSLHAQTPPPTPPAPAATATPPPGTTVPPFPSTPQFLRAFPGLEEDSWYIYASGFTPRVGWLIGEVPCGSLPCDRPLRAPVNDLVKEDGTMTFYVHLPKATEPSGERLLALAQGILTGSGPTIAFPGTDAPSIRVAGHNPGVGRGYPAGTKTGIPAVDDVIALSFAHDFSAIRARTILYDGETTAGTPVHGIRTWQCAPYVLSETSNVFFEYPSEAVYAVFRVPNDPALPERYEGAAYGIAWYDGGVGVPLGGLTLVSADGHIVGTEIRCGTTPGYHVHNFTDFILAPYAGPPITPVVPKPPSVGDSPEERGDSETAPSAFAGAIALATAGLASAWAVRARRRSHP